MVEIKYLKENFLLYENGLKVCKTFIKLYIEVFKKIQWNNKLFNLKQVLKIIITEIFEILNSFNMFDVFHSWFLVHFNIFLIKTKVLNFSDF